MHSHTERLISALRRGVCTSNELQATLAVSQPTLARALSEIGAGSIVRIGRARSSRYGLKRNVRGLGSDWPLYRIGEDGAASLVGRLCAIEGGQWYLDGISSVETLRGNEFRDGLYPDLPWFLQDLRPRGFLGRALARSYANELGTPRNPRDWNSDDIVHALLVHGSDLPGAFVLGRRTLAVAQSRSQDVSDVIDGQARSESYPVRADAIMGGETPGSSAAGEQPKFTTRVRNADGSTYCAIVKFSGAAGRSEDRRWADLLIAEHEANSLLTAAGIPCADTTVLESSGRCFLESTRFDRTLSGGRRGLVSLEAFDNAFFGAVDTPWNDAAIRYHDAGWLSRDDTKRLAMLWLFGELIGNTDMHYGNVSLFLEEHRPLSLAPTYDMVPMLYRPDIEGHLPDDPISLLPPPPEAAPLWLRAAGLAQKFWSRLARSNSISHEFRSIAETNAAVVENMQ